MERVLCHTLLQKLCFLGTFFSEINMTTKNKLSNFIIYLKCTCPRPSSHARLREKDRMKNSREKVETPFFPS